MSGYRLQAGAARDRLGLGQSHWNIQRNEQPGEWRVERGEGRGERVLGVIRNLNYTEYYSMCGYLKPQPTIWQNNKI